MHKIWVDFIRGFIKLGLFFYYKKIEVIGRENIPKKGAVLFVSNHQNALLDPLIIGTTNGRNTHFLTRAGVFTKKLIILFFNSVQMLPIYRIRDGWQSLAKNEAIFNRCHQLLNSKKALVIFPEGGHNLNRRIRPLSKGFTRIIFGALKKYPDLNIQIIPVGLNYNSILEYPASVNIHYGKPLDARKFFNENDLKSSVDAIKSEVESQMKLVTTHIESVRDYNKIFRQLSHSKTNFLDPISTNKKLETLILIEEEQEELNRVTNKKSFLYYLFVINSIIPWILWKKVSPKIKEKEFKSTFRFGLGITLFPTYYAVLSILIYSQFPLTFALSYLGISILLGLILTKTSKDPYDLLE